MKKTILFALLAMAVPAFAASIDWTLATGAAANYMVNSKGNKVTGTAYLLLTTDLPGEGEKFSSESAIIAKALGGADGALAITDGVNKTTKTSTDNRLEAPKQYSFTVLVYDTATKEYFTSAVAKSEKAYNLSGDEYTDPTSISLTASNLYASSSTRGTQNYVAVPEPSVAIMGLLGLGMLLKRRRA